MSKPVYLKTEETRLAGAERDIRFLKRRGQIPDPHPDYDPETGGGVTPERMWLQCAYQTIATTDPTYATLNWSSISNSYVETTTSAAQIKFKIAGLYLFTGYVSAGASVGGAQEFMATLVIPYTPNEHAFVLHGYGPAGYAGASFAEARGLAVNDVVSLKVKSASSAGTEIFRCDLHLVYLGPGF